jgi:hypothetical protein
MKNGRGVCSQHPCDVRLGRVLSCELLHSSHDTCAAEAACIEHIMLCYAARVYMQPSSC